MKKQKSRSSFRTILRWIVWVLLVQLILINISAALYAYKFTHLYSPEQHAIDQRKPVSQNIFAKTWRLFSGQRFYKSPDKEIPVFPYSVVTLKTKSGLAIETWYGKTDSAKGTVILFHGLSGNKSTVLQEAYEFRYWHYNVMLVDVRAHGNSEGSGSTIGFRESEEVKLAYDYVSAQGEKNIYLWGASMGAVDIIRATGEYGLSVKGLIAEMPFRSLQSHVKGRVRTMGFPNQPFSFFITFWIGAENGFNGLAFDNISYAKKITCPVLLQYAGSDLLVQRGEVEDIYKAFASSNKKIVGYEGIGHELLLHKNPVQWRKEVESFLQTIH